MSWISNLLRKLASASALKCRPRVKAWEAIAGELTFRAGIIGRMVPLPNELILTYFQHNLPQKNEVGRSSRLPCLKSIQLWGDHSVWHIPDMRLRPIHIEYRIYKDKYGRLNMISREHANRALIGYDSQWNATRWQALPSPNERLRKHTKALKPESDPLRCSAARGPVAHGGARARVTLGPAAHVRGCQEWEGSWL